MAGLRPPHTTYNTLAHFRSSVTPVSGHFICVQSTGIMAFPAKERANTTPNSSLAVVKKYDRASPSAITSARTISPGRKHLVISTLSISVSRTSCWRITPEKGWPARVLWPMHRISHTVVRWVVRVTRTITSSPGLGLSAWAWLRWTWTTGRGEWPLVSGGVAGDTAKCGDGGEGGGGGAGGGPRAFNEGHKGKARSGIYMS